MVNLLLNVIKFQRTGNWDGFLQVLKKFISFCFVLNRRNYARNLSSIYEYLTDIAFTASLSGLPFSIIP